MSTSIHIGSALLAVGKTIGSYEFLKNAWRNRSADRNELSQELVWLGATILALSVSYKYLCSSGGQPNLEPFQLPPHVTEAILEKALPDISLQTRTKDTNKE